MRPRRTGKSSSQETDLRRVYFRMTPLLARRHDPDAAFERRSYAEIAEILGLSVSAIETLLFRARRALREQIEGTLTCDGAERALSRQLDGQLPRAERGHLRA